MKSPRFIRLIHIPVAVWLYVDITRCQNAYSFLIIVWTIIISFVYSIFEQSYIQSYISAKRSKFTRKRTSVAQFVPTTDWTVRSTNSKFSCVKLLRRPAGTHCQAHRELTSSFTLFPCFISEIPFHKYLPAGELQYDDSYNFAVWLSWAPELG